MYQQPISAAARVNAWPPEKVKLRRYIGAHGEALLSAAALLAGKKGLTLVRDIRLTLDQPGPITSRLRKLLIELSDILALKNVHDETTEEAACFAGIDPADPVVEELCLLTDGLRCALLDAGVDPTLEHER